MTYFQGSTTKSRGPVKPQSTILWAALLLWNPWIANAFRELLCAESAELSVAIPLSYKPESLELSAVNRAVNSSLGSCSPECPSSALLELGSASIPLFFAGILPVHRKINLRVMFDKRAKLK